MDSFDFVILGGGPAGERAALQAAKLGHTSAIVERYRVVGGTAINWGAIPGKTLRESALFVRGLTSHRQEGLRCEISPDNTIADLMHRERQVVQRELALINWVLDRRSVEILHGTGRFVDAHTIRVEGDEGERLVHGEKIIIATGATPNRPTDVPFDDEVVFDSDTILKMPRVPKSVVVYGAGVIGVEYASIFAAIGAQVTLLDTRPRMLPYMDREIGNLLVKELNRLGVEVLHDWRYRSVERLETDPPSVRIIPEEGESCTGDILLYCAGRDGNSRDLGLEQIDIEPSSRGLLEVNDHYQTTVPNVYAVGDIIGYPALASTSMEQGRRAVRHACGEPRAKRDDHPLPFAIYAIPEVSYIGETEESLTAAGVDYVSGRGRYDMNPRGQILGDRGGLLKLLFRTSDMQLVGVHILGTNASELIHIGQAFLYGGTTAEQIFDTLYNYPTLSDLYRHAALEALFGSGR